MIDIDYLKTTAGESGFWYLASPYSLFPEGTDAAFRKACFAAGRLIDNGVPVFCPIAHSHPIAFHGCIDPLSHEIWLPADEPFMRAAVGLLVYMMPGWKQSYGIAKETEFFRAAGKPVVEIPYPIKVT